MPNLIVVPLRPDFQAFIRQLLNACLGIFQLLLQSATILLRSQASLMHHVEIATNFSKRQLRLSARRKIPSLKWLTPFVRCITPEPSITWKGDQATGQDKDIQQSSGNRRAMHPISRLVPHGSVPEVLAGGMAPPTAATLCRIISIWSA
jgi:hypothetical protein